MEHWVKALDRERPRGGGVWAGGLYSHGSKLCWKSRPRQIAVLQTAVRHKGSPDTSYVMVD